MSQEQKANSLPLHDKFGRAITDLRISITDRCNYKCVYCRTGNEGALYGDLPFEDYLRMARVLVGMGINKVRLTGGEPLLRKGVVEFVRELAGLRAANGNGNREALDNASCQALLREIRHSVCSFTVRRGMRQIYSGQVHSTFPQAAEAIDRFA